MSTINVNSRETCSWTGRPMTKFEKELLASEEKENAQYIKAMRMGTDYSTGKVFFGKSATIRENGKIIHHIDGNPLNNKKENLAMLAENDNQCGSSAERSQTAHEKFEERAILSKKVSIKQFAKTYPEGYNIFGKLNRVQLMHECTSNMYSLQWHEMELERKKQMIQVLINDQRKRSDANDQYCKEIAVLKDKVESLTNLLENQSVASTLLIKTLRSSK